MDERTWGLVSAVEYLTSSKELLEPSVETFWAGEDEVILDTQAKTTDTESNAALLTARLKAEKITAVNNLRRCLLDIFFEKRRVHLSKGFIHDEAPKAIRSPSGTMQVWENLVLSIHGKDVAQGSLLRAEIRKFCKQGRRYMTISDALGPGIFLMLGERVTSRL